MTSVMGSPRFYMLSPRRQGRIKRHNIWSSTIASAITIGIRWIGRSRGADCTDGVGDRFQFRECVQNGAPDADVAGRLWRGAGAIAGIFKAPIAGLVFTLEVLMIDLTMSSLLPLLISAVTAATVSYIITGTEAMFKFHLDQAFELERIPFVILLGNFLRSDFAVLYACYELGGRCFGKLNNPYKKLAFGGVMLSILISFSRLFMVKDMIQSTCC